MAKNDMIRTDGTIEPAADPTAPKIAALESQIAELRALLLSQQQPALPGNVQMVSIVDPRSLREQEAIQARVSKGNVQITQEEADRLFPEGKRQFDCHLDDGNRQPKIRIRADYEEDAKGRYLKVCGINHTDKPVQVTEVAKAAPAASAA